MTTRYTYTTGYTAGVESAIVTDFSTDAVTLELFHYDEIYFARIQALPILSKIAHQGSGSNAKRAIIDALELLAIRLNDMADELRD